MDIPSLTAAVERAKKERDAAHETVCSISRQRAERRHELKRLNEESEAVAAKYLPKRLRSNKPTNLEEFKKEHERLANQENVCIKEMLELDKEMRQAKRACVLATLELNRWRGHLAIEQRMIDDEWRNDMMDDTDL